MIAFFLSLASDFFEHAANLELDIGAEIRAIYILSSLELVRNWMGGIQETELSNPANHIT
jgi:hypothetical protein